MGFIGSAKWRWVTRGRPLHPLAARWFFVSGVMSSCAGSSAETDDDTDGRSSRSADGLVCLGVPLPLPSDGHMDRESNGCGFQGYWYWFQDLPTQGTELSDVNDGEPPYRSEAGMCLTGRTIVDATFAAWGAGFGVTLNQPDDTSGRTFDLGEVGIDAFEVTVEGSFTQDFRMAFATDPESTDAAPFVALRLGTQVVRVTDAVIPTSWEPSDTVTPGLRADARRVGALQFLVAGGSEAAAFDVCISKLTPLSVEATADAPSSSSDDRDCAPETICDGDCEYSCTLRCTEAGVGTCNCDHCCSQTGACYYSSSDDEAWDPACDAATCSETNGVASIRAEVRGHIYEMSGSAEFGNYPQCTRDGVILTQSPAAGAVGCPGGDACVRLRVGGYWQNCCGW